MIVCKPCSLSRIEIPASQLYESYFKYSTVPDAPTNVEVSQVGENEVEVTWNGPASTVSGYAVVVNGQSPTTVSAQPLSHSVALPPGSHSISVASLSTVQGEQLYSTSTDAVTVLGEFFPLIDQIFLTVFFLS